MDAQQGARRCKFDEKVPVGHGVHRILGDARAPFRIHEPKESRRIFPVYGERRAREGSGAERALVCLACDLRETHPVALEHFHPGEEVVGGVDRLGALQMGVAGDDHRPVFLGHGKKGPLDRRQLPAEQGARVLEKEPHVRRHLVVPAAGRVELGRRRHPQRERPLDVHVDVLEAPMPPELAVLDLPQDRVQAGVDCLALRGRDEADTGQHRRMRLAPGNVERSQPPVNGDRFAECEHQRRGARGEAPSPGGLFVLGHG